MFDLADDLPSIILIGILLALLQAIGKALWPRIRRAHFPVVRKLRHFESRPAIRTVLARLLFYPAENAVGWLVRACFFMCVAALVFFAWDQVFDDAAVPALLYLLIVAAAVGWSIMGRAADRVTGSIRPRPLWRTALLAYRPGLMAAWIAHSLFYACIALFFINWVEFGILEALPGLTGTAIVFVVARYLDRTSEPLPATQSGPRLPNFFWRALENIHELKTIFRLRSGT